MNVNQNNQPKSNVMKTVHAKVKNINSDHQWSEEFKVEDGIDAETFIKAVIQNFNNTLKPGEMPREFVQLEMPEMKEMEKAAAGFLKDVQVICDEYKLKLVARNPKVKIFYTPKQVCDKDIWEGTSRSPLKPRLVVDQLSKLVPDNIEIDGTFSPYKDEDFQLAHTKDYVFRYFAGAAGGNGLTWSPELAESIRYTNASLYNAIRYSIEHPETVCFSPTSGFHHARPDGGGGFCTFSGQVIAATKLYQDLGVSGAIFDLDGHFGNSIEDSRQFVKSLDESIPRGFNVNPSGQDKSYVHNLKEKMKRVGEEILAGNIQYVLWCHGADSHSDDDLGGQVDTEHWLECSKLFFAWVKEIDEKLGRPLPVSMALFGGYRRNDYDSVINLHTADFITALNTLCGASIVYEHGVKDKPKSKFDWSSFSNSRFGSRGVKTPSWDKSAWLDSVPEKEEKKLSKNEREILEYLESMEDDAFRSGMHLGMIVKGWKNHSVTKWCKKLVNRGLVESGSGGFRAKQVADEEIVERGEEESEEFLEEDNFPSPNGNDDEENDDEENQFLN